MLFRSGGGADLCRAYFKQLRETTVARMPDLLFLPDGKPNKWWLLFAKKKFMNKELSK